MAYMLKTTGAMIPLPDLLGLPVAERFGTVCRAMGGPYTELALPGGEELMLIAEGDGEHALTVNHPATAVAYQTLAPGTFIRGDVIVCLRSELTAVGPERDPDLDVLEMLPEPVTFYPPFYLVKGVFTCSGCGKDFLAAAVLASNAVDGGATTGPAYFCNIPELPAKLHLEIRWHVPLYRKRVVENDVVEYFANACPDCGKVVSDRALFQADGPFAASNHNRSSMKLLLYEEPVTLCASLEKRDGPL